jgi:hypothetical protein
MTKTSQQPETNQRQTRAKNANTHPGRTAMEALAVRRKREVIELEKKAKEERHQAREKKKADREAAVIDIADFENRMALDDFEQEDKFPRHQAEGEPYSVPVNTLMQPILRSNSSQASEKRKK